MKTKTVHSHNQVMVILMVMNKVLKANRVMTLVNPKTVRKVVMVMKIVVQ